jgi:WD40 repeat protein
MKDLSRKDAKTQRTEEGFRKSNLLCAFASLREICISLRLCAIYLLLVITANAAEPPVTYQDHLLPLLRETCFNCHNNDKTEGDLNMTSFASLMRGGGSGAVIAPGDLDGSYLYQLVTHKSEPHMPPNAAKLADEKLAVIRKFIEGGALETSGSKPAKADKPKANLAVSSSLDKPPEGPPPMPPRLPLQPVVRASRAGAITALAASPWAPLAAVAGQQQVLLYHTDTFELLGVLPFPEGTPQVLKFSRSGKLLLAGGGHAAKSGRVVVWDITTGKRVIEVGDEFDSVLAADISPDQTLIALGGPSKVVRIFSTADGKLLHEIKKHTDWITAIEFNPDNVLLATGDRNGGLFVWEAAGAQEFFSLRGHSAAISAVSWRRDGNVLASASEDSSVRLWEMNNGNQIKTWNAHGGGVRSVEFCRDGRIVTGGRDHNVQRWTGEGKADGNTLKLTDVTMQAVTTFKGERLIAGDWAGEVRVYSTADWKQIGSLNANPPALEERLQAAEREVAAAEAKHKQIGEVATASQQAAAALAAQFDEAQKEAQVAKEAEGRSRAEVAQLKSTIEKTTAEIETVKRELSQREAAVELLGQAAAKASEAVKKLPGSAPLTEAVAKLNDASQAMTKELTALQKSAQEKNAALAAGREQLTAAEGKLAAASAPCNAAQEKSAAAAVAKKSADDQAATDKQAVEQAAAALNAAQSVKQRWADEIAFVQTAK